MKTMTGPQKRSRLIHNFEELICLKAKTRTWLEERLADPQERLGFEQERAILLATDEIYRAMKARGITKAELAKKIGRSKAYVSQVLSGSRNMTLRTLAEFAWACDQTVNIELSPSEGAGFILHGPSWRSAAESVRFTSPEFLWRFITHTTHRSHATVSEPQPEGLSVAA